MPMWLEICVLMLAGYAAGIAIGWALWGRDQTRQDMDE